ncbi:type II toxin-antitoxin system RelE/ParE family toxin [Methylovulum psychrotolerans]|uniref:type II toxin-antitoxin system RelE/ParE family toxin n=1 Tax=Methylovulum psychrotolerans TaxID=1704499 RepID=UPI0012F72FC9|nr:type II toxin-antitoxin system RelE/ParE family toxin [Methylovulum psychrotolerans]MBT9099257.1 hypothetical protein [Methylovulum psychrotolerans]
MLLLHGQWRVGACPKHCCFVVRFLTVIYAIHAFQKKSEQGIATSKNEIELIGQRLRKAKEPQINLLLEERGLKQREAAELHSF